MERTKFVKETIMSLDDSIYEQLKNRILDEYISFSIIAHETISVEVFAEKLCDYFEKIELKTGKSFDKQLEAYIEKIDDIVKSRIAKTPQPKKKDTTPVVVPRSRKYYERALQVKNSRSLTLRQLSDYVRIMMCLYAEIIKNKYTEISNFDYAISSIDMDVILEAMKTETDPLFKKKSRFNTKDLYSLDTCAFIITMIMLCYIMDNEVQGDYYHG